ncbi:MAG: hypothetical protein O4861_17300 [Trichodesmium sp. St16_bin4-tuft]|nr:hypothetical protein [Trichodesmium sp. St16_bin4-tuft]
MGKKSPKLSPGWLEPEQLMEFIDQLRREYKYNIGVSQYIAAQELILALSAKGEQLEEPQRLKSLLGPLLCSSPAEQEDFQLRFDQWMERMGFTVREIIHADENAEALEQELKKMRQEWRWLRWVRLAIAVFLVIVLTNFLIQDFSALTSPMQQFPTPIGDPLKLFPPQIPQEWQTTFLWLILVPPVTFLVWRLWWRWRVALYLNRRQTRRPPEIQRVSISGLNEELFPRVLFLRIAQGLRRRIRVPSNELDIDKTVEKTVRGGVRFAPVYGYYKLLPEYLVLIDRANYSDHQARLVKEMIAQLTENEVLIIGYYFDGDPRVCFPVTGKGSPCKLREISLKYSQHRLLIFSDAEGFFNSLTGELEAWLDLFSSWSQRAVFTPKPSEHWGYQELKLSREFIVLPATNDGLIDLIRSIEHGKLPYVSSEKGRAPYPEALRVRGRRWVEQDPPEPWLLTNVLGSVRNYLGEAGYYWLSACAVFPELNWNLTVYLGNALNAGDGGSLLQACRLTVLARLPWFRYGYMPDWLRLWLVSELPRHQEDEVRQLLIGFLVAKPDEQGSVGRWQLEIARQYSNVVSRLVQPLLRLFSGEAPEDSPLRDYIFQEFMAGRKGLAVRMPEELREELRRKYSQQVGWRFWFQWVLANMVGGVVGFFVGLLVVQWANNIMVSFRLAVFGTVFGAVVGSLQWWVLRKRLSQARWWILATALASAILFSTSDVLSNAVRDVVSNTVIQGVVISSLIGLVIGSAQWLVLRKQLSQSHWWILASVLGITATLFASFYYSRLEQASSWNFIFWLSIFGIIYGVITGFALVWLLRQPGNSVRNNKK